MLALHVTYFYFLNYNHQRQNKVGIAAIEKYTVILNAYMIWIA